MLPRLLHCVEWNDRYEVCEITALLDKWPILRIEKALELLDYAYADQTVRSFAVKCLKNIGYVIFEAIFRIKNFSKTEQK